MKVARSRGWSRSVPLVVGLMAVGLLISACTAPWTTTPTPKPHASFGYSKLGSIDTSKPYHPGDVITFTWTATLEGTVHQANPDDITLRAGVYGPFDTVDHLKQQMSSTKAPGLQPTDDLSGAAAKIDPIQTDSWRPENYTSNLVLPKTLKPGYYSLVQSVTTTSKSGSSTGSGQTILQVVAP